MYRPELPPRAGYVEQLVDGVATYVPTKETLRLLELQEENKLKDAQIKALSERNDFMDDCIAEMAAEVYK